jgi:integrase
VTRSAPGSGSMKQTASGAWRLVVSLPSDPVTGSRRQLVRTVRGSKTQARTALNALLAERGSGRLDGSAITVAGLVAEWLDNETELSPTTKVEYQRMRRWLRGPFGQRPASKVTVAEVRDLYRHLAKDGVSAFQVQQLHKVLSRAFNLGMRWEWLVRNPIAFASPPPAKGRATPMPSDDDVRRLLAAAGGDFAVWLRVCAATGMRRGEVCGLQWADVDLERAVLLVARAVVVTAGGPPLVKGTKTNRVRVFAIDETTCKMLDAHRLVCIERARWVDHVPLLNIDRAFVFSMELDGSKPWRPDLASHRYDRLRKQVGISVPLKSLRHDSVSYLLSEGADPNNVANRHGHARTSMTLDVYGHAVPARDRDLAELVGRRLDGS